MQVKYEGTHGDDAVPASAVQLVEVLRSGSHLEMGSLKGLLRNCCNCEDVVEVRVACLYSVLIKIRGDGGVSTSGNDEAQREWFQQVR